MLITHIPGTLNIPRMLLIFKYMCSKSLHWLILHFIRFSVCAHIFRYGEGRDNWIDKRQFYFSFSDIPKYCCVFGKCPTPLLSKCFKMQSVFFFIVTLSTTAVTEYAGGCRFSMGWSCRAQGHDKRDSLYYEMLQYFPEYYFYINSVFHLRLFGSICPPLHIDISTRFT